MSRGHALLLSVLLLGCSRTGDKKPVPAPPTTVNSPHDAAAKSGERTRPFSFSRLLMGTPFTILIDDPVSEAQAQKSAFAAFTEIARIESLMSEWRADSEVSAINRRAGQSPVSVSRETRAVIQKSLTVSARSRGAFDITWAAFRGLWSFESPGQIPAADTVRKRLNAVGWQHIKVDSQQGTVFIGKPDVQIGMGGIAKGYGIDRAVSVLQTHGLKQFLVNGGGDLVGVGSKRSGASWMVGVQHPRKKGQMLTRLPVADGAVVSSGDYERFFERDGVRYHHILDLKTGYPAQKSIAVTVQAPSATMADALCTAIFVLGPDDGLRFAEEMEDVEVAILAPDGRIARSKGMTRYFPPRWDQR